MNQLIVISNPCRWHIPFYFPKPSKLSPNAQTFIYTHRHIKIMEIPYDIKTNYKRLNRIKPENFEISDKENIPPPPPIMLKRSYSNRHLTSHDKW
jgi:hypothetical protein